MSKRRCFVAILIGPLAILIGTQAAHPQGIQPFSTQAPGPNTTVDLASSNVLLSIPIRSKIGAIPFNYSLIANLSPTLGIGATGLAGTTTGPSSEATARYSLSQKIQCGTPGQGEYYLELSGWYVVDSTGAHHSVAPGEFIEVSFGTAEDCLSSGPLKAVTEDSSGYTLSLTPIPAGYKTSITNRSGITSYPDVPEIVDPDGNTINPAGPFQYIDTLGQVALSENGQTYSYTDQNGNTQSYTVGYTTEHWKTNFPAEYCPGTEVAAYSMPTSITQNSTGQEYLITYEPTPGYPGDVTGRIQQITFPSGGYVKYTYSGGSNGLDCNTLVIPTLTKTVSDGVGNLSTWTYVNTYNTLGSLFTVTETDPSGNQTVYTFSGEYQLQKQSYQGTSASGTLLTTTVTCYNGNFSNCTSATLPQNQYSVGQTDVFTYLQNSPSASLVETKYTVYGTVAEIKQYDFGAATTLPPTTAPATTPIDDTTISYDGNGASCGTLTVTMYDRPCSVTVTGTSGTASQVNYTYNATGHPIQAAKLVSGSTYLTSSATYNSNGTVASSTDVNGATTNYYYNGTGGCNNLLLTSTSLPTNNLSTSQTWDCNGGVLTSATDANGQPTTYGYQSSGGTADPFWRMLSVTDPLGNTTWTIYSETAPFTQETSLQFNGSASRAECAYHTRRPEPPDIRANQASAGVVDLRFGAIQVRLDLEHWRVFYCFSGVFRDAGAGSTRWHRAHHKAVGCNRAATVRY
jgi:hypothetical protein